MIARPTERSRRFHSLKRSSGGAAKFAELLDMPDETVKVRLHRARRALAEHMEER
jgi:hypothetical protein